MAATFSYTKRHRHSAIAYPDLGPWAGLLLGLCALFMTPPTARFRFADQAPYVRVPITSFKHTNGLRESHSLTLSIDSENRIYIAADNEKLQTAIIEQVAQQHRIRFTSAQLSELRKMSFLSQDIRRLPAWLTASTIERQQLPSGIPAMPGNDQLSEYIAVSISASLTLFDKPIFFTLRADERLTAAQIKYVISLLQRQGINRFHVLTEVY